MRRILHIDMDAFFSAVEQKRHPELVGKPVVVGGGGDPTQRGVVSTASYEARKFGIHSAMPLRTAYRLCPEAVFLPVDYEEYSRVSETIKNILREFSPIVEDVGIDEAFLDISSIDKPSQEIAGEIKKRIREETDLTCSIGIAPNKLLAKMASDMQKPNGLTMIAEEDIESRIWPLPVRKLWGVGPKTETYLKEMGIKTIGELASLSLDRLIEEFGQSYGNYLYEASRGMDESPLITHWEPKSISRETTFQKDVSDWQVIAKTLAELTKDVVTSMKEEGYQSRTITVKVRFSDFRTYTRAKTLDESTDSLEEIRKAAFGCLKKFELKKKVRLIGVRVGNLAPQPPQGVPAPSLPTGRQGERGG
jgi:DNA polymerase-4